MSNTPLGEYLFSPVQVANTLASLPNLRSRLQDPHQEGRQSQAFPKGRRSPRQIFKVLGNDHYEHLASLLRTLDRCIGAGFDQPNLIRPRSWKTLAESLAELHIADHLLEQGFGVRSFDARKGNESVPDILVLRGSTQWAAIEVYTPRRWEGLEQYQDALRDALKNLDEPYDFHCAITHGVIDGSRAGRSVGLHPGALSRELERIDVDAHVSLAVDQLAANLDAGHTTASVRLDALNLVTSIDCDATPAAGSLPARRITQRGPPLSAFAPEHDFVRIAERAVKKLHRGQARTVPSAIPCLVVDLSQANFESELAHASYRDMFLQTLRTQFADLRGHGLVAFVHGMTWSKPPSVLWMRLAPNVPDELGEVFGRPELPT